MEFYCKNCGRKLQFVNGEWLCPVCNNQSAQKELTLKISKKRSKKTKEIEENIFNIAKKIEEKSMASQIDNIRER